MTPSHTPFRLNAFSKAVLMFSLPLAAWAQESPSQGAAQTLSQDQAPATPAPTPATVTRLKEVTVQARQPHDDYNTDVSTVGGKAPTATRDVPQSLTIVNRALLDAQGATSLEQALRYVPGITFTAAEGGTIGNNINLRGFSARTDIYLDTFRDRGQYYRDTFFLDSVEVLEGPSSMLFGRGSTGGIINQSSKLPQRTPRDEVTASIGTSDQYRFTGDFNHPLTDSAALRIPVVAQAVHSTRDVMHNQDYGAAPSLRLDLSPKTVFIVSTLLEHNHDQPDYGLPPLNNKPAPVSRDNFYGFTDDATRQDVQVINGNLRYQTLPNLTLRNQAQYSKYRIDARETAANSVGTCPTTDPTCTNSSDFVVLPTKTTGNTTALPTSQLFVQLGSHDRFIRDSSAFDQADATWNVRTGPLDHLLLVGFELGRDTYKNQGYTLGGPGSTAAAAKPLQVVSLDDPNYETEAQGGVIQLPGNLVQSSATTYAGYVNDTITFAKYFKAIGGVRWDRYDAKLTTTAPAGGPPLSSTTAPSAQQTVYYDSVRAGLLYQPDEEQTYYVSYGTSFDPSLEQLTVTNGTQAVPPEKNRSYEVGSKWDLFQDSLALTAALFQIEKTNARSQIETGVYELDGTIRVNGGELTAAGHITPKWQVFSGYTYLDPEIVKASALDNITGGKTPANVPRNNATLWTSYLPRPSWEAGTGLVYSSSREVTNTDVVSVPGFTRWDATVAYHQPHYDVRLNVLNLTNTHYFDSVIQSDGGRSVPGITRSALVTFNYRF